MKLITLIGGPEDGQIVEIETGATEYHFATIMEDEEATANAEQGFVLKTVTGTYVEAFAHSDIFLFDRYNAD